MQVHCVSILVSQITGEAGFLGSLDVTGKHHLLFRKRGNPMKTKNKEESIEHCFTCIFTKNNLDFAQDKH